MHSQNQDTPDYYTEFLFKNFINLRILSAPLWLEKYGRVPQLVLILFKLICQFQAEMDHKQ